MNKIKEKVLAIIPARYNSKALKNKNLRLLEGHPLIAYSIAAAASSKVINRIICSTDSMKIASVARKYGAETPFLRPKNLSRDNSTDLDCFVHCLNWLKKHENYIPDIVVHLRPTCPVRFRSDINKAIETIKSNVRIDSVRSLSSINYTPFKMWKVTDRNYIQPIMKINKIETFNLPRQELPKTYYHNGVIDIIRTSTIVKKNSMSGKFISPIFLKSKYCYDIDTLDDLILVRKQISKIRCIKP